MSNLDGVKNELLYFEMIYLVQDRDWNTLADRLSNYLLIDKNPSETCGSQLLRQIILQFSDESVVDGATMDTIMSLIYAIIEHWGSRIVDVIAASELQGQTLLHLAVLTESCYPQPLQALVNAAPHCSHWLDNEQRRPIDHLSQIIVMVEERAKYERRRRWDHDLSLALHTQQRQELLEQRVRNYWECAQILAVAMRPQDQDIEPQQQQQLMFHACLQARNFPTVLMERVLRRYPEQLQQADRHGKPLHLFMSRRRRAQQEIQPTIHHLQGGGEDVEWNFDLTTTTTTSSEYVEDNEDDDDLELLSAMLSRYPDAARRRNQYNQCPFDVAMANGGYGWKTGIRLLLQAFPEVLLIRDDIGLPHYSIILHRMLKDDDYNTPAHDLVFALLKATPSLFQR